MAEKKKTNNKGKATTKSSTTSKQTKNTKVVKTTTKVSKPEVKKDKVETKTVKVVEEPKVVTKNSNKKDEKGIMEKVTQNTPFAISLVVILVLVIALLVVIFCVKRVPKTSDGKQVLATLNGKEITADDLYLELKDKYGTDTLMQMIDEYIASKEVKITKEDKEYVQGIVDNWKSQAESYDMDLIDLLAYYGLNVESEDEFYDYLLNNYKTSLAVVHYIADEAKESDLKDYYKENFGDKQTVKHILIEVDPEAEDQEKADEDAKKLAESLIKTLDKTDAKKLDAKFEELAKKNSDDTATYSNGGLIEDFRKNDVVEEFYEASSKLKDGEYTSEPVKTSYGYHIILKVSSTKAEKYDDIKDEVKKAYAEDLMNNDSSLQVSKWDELRKAYKLKFKDDNMKKAYEDLVKSSLEQASTEETETEE